MMARVRNAYSYAVGPAESKDECKARPLAAFAKTSQSLAETFSRLQPGAGASGASTSTAKLLTKLVTSRAAARQWQEALRLLSAELFKKPFVLDVVAFNAGISACRRGSHWPGALALVAEMRGRRLLPDAVTYNSCLSSCADSELWLCSMALLGDMRRPALSGHADAFSVSAPDAFSFSAAISACARATEWRNALELLGISTREGLPEVSPSRPDKNAISNAAISAMAKSQQWRRVLVILAGVELPDAITFTATASAFVAEERWPTSLRLLQQMQQSQVQPNLITINTIASASAATHGWAKSLKLLSSVSARAMELDVVSLSAAVSALGSAAAWPEVLSLLLNLQIGCHSPLAGSRKSSREAPPKGLWHLRGLRPNEVTWALAAAACSRAGRWLEALGLLSYMRHGQLRPSLVAVSACVSACEKNGFWQPALHLLADLWSESLPVDVIAVNSAMSACAKDPEAPFGSAWLWAVHLLGRALGEGGSTRTKLSPPDPGGGGGVPAFPRHFAFSGLELSVISWNACVSACAASGQWEQSMNMLASMRARSSTPDAYTHAGLISACAQRSMWLQALGLCEASHRAIEHSTRASLVTTNAAIAACERSHCWAAALALLQELPEYRLAADETTYHCILGACTKAAPQSSESRLCAEASGCRWPQASGLLVLAMRDGLLRPSSLLLGAVLGAVERHSQPAMTQELLLCSYAASFLPLWAQVSPRHVASHNEAACS
ncbi:unnamed protein product [Polarella glacialis]|uniref:Pentatricopeptide repeat-containing protein, chloroplastic n=1 Tax=Polarella glacialis TaxID=89957 RepID=A0A813JCE7_POLGL|nr:unnamed protein product [Polarella glacialis]